MAITSIKVHPAIGVARLGNSPDEFFIGPERLWEKPDPPGGFKDAQCRVKRQAARFRIFAYHDDGTIDEITSAEADITWTVHLANKKAVKRNSGSAADLTIDPGARTLNGPNQRKEFDNGKIKLPGASAVTVPLGEIRTDDDGRLLVLGGFGKSASPNSEPITEFLDNAGWYDDISDGPVTASIKLHATGDTFNALGAWVLVAPPKFAPQIDNVITLYDRVFQMGADQGWQSGPAVPSYTNDIYPILQRARDTKWVVNVFGAHAWPDPVFAQPQRQAIFNRLANPGGGGGNMPQLQNATLTAIQYQVMQKWKDGNFTQDWVAPPAPASQVTPQGLDQSSLGNCVGAAFFPGIEAGGIAATPIIDPTKYIGAADPMRLNHATLSPGAMSEFMALPWQADFYACGTNWWPVPRPNSVIPQGTSSYQAWDRDVGSYEEMVNEWHTLGFVVKQGAEYVEVDRCDTTFITLLTPHLNFQDVPQGPMGMSRKTALAIVFEVRSTGGAVTLEAQPGDGPSHPRLKLDATSDTVGPTVGNQIATSRLWVIYETGPVNEVITDQVTVRHAASGRAWTVTITANTVARKIAAAALVLDRSSSMSEDRGDGQTKYQSLKEAASIFVDVMVEGDGVGLARYNQDAQPLQSVTALGPAGDPFDMTRLNTKNIINGADLAPSGATSIGDGIFEGRQILNAAGSGYDLKALVVMTDGKENRERWISDVSAEINERTYAVGLGTPENTSAPALQTISGNHGGYLLVTGAITGDNRFILQKYFLQILAGISNAEIVLDPDGELILGHEQRIPFQLTEADSGMDVILLTSYPQIVDFRLQAPTGQIIEPWRAIAEPDMIYVLSAGVSYYRIVLPVELLPSRYDQAGTWHALLTIGRPRLSRPDSPGVLLSAASLDAPRRIPPQTGPDRASASFNFERAAAVVVQGRRTLPYSLLVHSYSNLSLRASLDQSGFEPGARVALHATLAESGIPARPGAYVWAEITRPDGTRGAVELNEADPSQFNGSFTTGLSGVYRCRIRASGRTRAGHPFHREQTLTAAVWRGGDFDADPNNSGGGPL
ncbi:MAG TPA: LodA/GoxA family CTQ-dependent oxidase, partial [Blastocatellia bacterium]|nr:LodA/GoxA family CTQ-dependent oxidase [Blastocatellia bacterium]